MLSRKQWHSFAGSWPLSRSAKRLSVFHPEFISDLRHWTKFDRKVVLKVLDLVETILRDPFSGIGKPEPLKHALSGFWSRRINDEHRLVYSVDGNVLRIAQARYHY